MQIPVHLRCTQYSIMLHLIDICFLTMTIDSGRESNLPACGPPASLSAHLASSAVTPAGSVHKSRGDNVMRIIAGSWHFKVVVLGRQFDKPWLAIYKYNHLYYVEIFGNQKGEGCRKGTYGSSLFDGGPC